METSAYGNMSAQSYLTSNSSTAAYSYETSVPTSANSTDFYDLYDNSTIPRETPDVTIAIFTSILSFVIVLGNGLIIASVAFVKKLRQPANYLIVSLALSDFLVGLVVLPFTITTDILGHWIFGPMICDAHVTVDVITCTASIMNLCMISIDRLVKHSTILFLNQIPSI